MYRRASGTNLVVSPSWQASCESCHQPSPGTLPSWSAEGLAGGEAVWPETQREVGGRLAVVLVRLCHLPSWPRYPALPRQRRGSRLYDGATLPRIAGSPLAPLSRLQGRRPACRTGQHHHSPSVGGMVQELHAVQAWHPWDTISCFLFKLMRNPRVEKVSTSAVKPLRN